MKSYVLFGTIVAIVALLVAAPTAQAGWISPTATPSSSGGPYGGIASLGADKTIDGDLNTYCVLLDDTLSGSDPASTPPFGGAPTTGHILYDLGAIHSINGAKMTDHFYWDNGTPTDTCSPKSVDYYLSDVSGSETKLLQSHEYSALPSTTAPEIVSWAAIDARYIKMVIKSSYEENAAGYGNYNFQFAEMQFSQVPEPTTLAMCVSGTLGLLAYAWRKRR